MGRTNTNQHDSGDKQFSGAFNNHIVTGYETSEGMFEEINQLVDMVFSQHATALNYDPNAQCGKKVSM